MLHLKNLCFSYQESLLENVDFTFESGQLYMLLARNGAGKSTFFKLLAGELAPRQGKIYASGAITLHRQNPLYFEDMTVRENLECFLQILDTRSDYKSLIEKYELQRIEKKVAKKLSGGEKQRLYLALTGMIDDPIQLYDEADSALDASARQTYYTDILKKSTDRGNTVIAISHHVSESLRHADKVCILFNRKLYEIDTAQLPPGTEDMNEEAVMQRLERMCVVYE